jgi:hypothetical protein
MARKKLGCAKKTLYVIWSDNETVMKSIFKDTASENWES